MSAEAVEEQEQRQAGPGLADVVAAVMGVDPAGLTDEDGPATVPGWTSRKQIELIVTLEELYGVELSHQEAFGARTLGALRGLLHTEGRRRWPN
jgi:acyl carrier protein